MSTTAVAFDLAPQDADLAPTRFVDSDPPTWSPGRWPSPTAFHRT